MDIKYDKTNFITTVSLFNRNAKINNADYRVKGIELYVDYRFTDKFSTSGSLTWLNAENASEIPYQYDINYFARANMTYQPGNLWTFEAILNSRQGSTYNMVSSAIFNADFACSGVQLKNSRF